MKRIAIGVSAGVFIAVVLWLRRATPAPPYMVASRSDNQQSHAARGDETRVIAPNSLPRIVSRDSTHVETASRPKARALREDQPALFARFVALGQGFALGEALEKNALNADAYVDRLCNETRKLRENPAMPEMNSAQRDAAEFMAPLMDYDVPMGELPGRLHLPGELRRRITGYGVDWPTSVTDEDLSTLDFTWMAELGTYDHWTLFGAGRCATCRQVRTFSPIQF